MFHTEILSFLASKYTLAAWEPFTASSLRFLLATLLIGAGMLLLGRKIQTPKTGKDWFAVFGVALTGFGFLYPLQLTGLKYVSSGMSAAIMLTSPLFVLIFGQLFLKERLSFRKIGAIALGILGGVVLLSANNDFNSTHSSGFVIGSLLTLVASLSLAMSVIVTRKASKILDSGSLTFWSMLIGFLLLAVSAQVFENQNFLNVFQRSTSSALIALTFLSFVCSAFCFFIWNYALTKASPKEIASTMHIKTPTAVILGATLAKEAIGINLVLGTVLVMSGVILSQTTGKGQSK